MLSCHTNVFIWHVLQLVAKATNFIKFRLLTGCDLWQILFTELQMLYMYVNRSDSFEWKPGEIFHSCKDLDLDLTLQICWSICVCHGVQVGHDEVIILSLPCDLRARRTWLFVFHLLMYQWNWSFNIPPGNPLGISIFGKFLENFSLTGLKSSSNAPSPWKITRLLFWLFSSFYYASEAVHVNMIY